MQRKIRGLKEFFEHLPELLRRNRIAVVACFLVVTVMLGAGAGRIMMDNSLDSFFRESDPVKKEYDTFKAVFGGDEYVYIVYKAKDGDIFSGQSLHALKVFYDEIANYRLKLSPDESSPFDHIVEIKSLINIKYLEASRDTLYSRAFIGDDLPETAEARERLRAKALNHPDYPFLYLSEDSAYGGILLRTDYNSEIDTGGGDLTTSVTASGFDEDDLFGDESEGGTYFQSPEEMTFIKTEMTEYPFLISALNDLMEKKEIGDALEFHPVGKPVLMDFFSEAVLKDLGRIMGFVMVLILVSLCVLFRSLSAVVWPVVVIIATLVWVTGFIGWSGVTMSIMFQIIVFLILSAGVADSVHIMSGYLFFRNRKLDHKRALNAVMKKSGLACFLTSVTTAVGLMSLVLVPIKPIAVFGIFSAIGVLVAFVLTVTLMPLMLDLWNPAPKKERSKPHFIQTYIQKIENIGPGRAGTVITVFALLSVLLFVGLMKLRIDSDEVEVLKNGFPLRVSYNLVNQHMGGTSNLEISLDFKEEDALKDPEVLNKMEDLQAFMESAEGAHVVKTYSLVNVAKDSFKALNNGDQGFYTIPQDPAVLSQTLFLFSNANPKDRRRVVTDDYSKARIGIHSRNTASVESLAFKETVEAYIDGHFRGLKKKYPGTEITLTGNMVLVSVMLDYISWSQIKSFGLTLVVISVILLLVFGNMKAGLVAIIPNVFPILTTFGLMGFLGIPLDMDTLLIAPVIIGLAVDDTIHFLTHYRLEMDKTGDIKQAAVNAIRESGQAICFTSLILAAGFSMFVLSFHNGLSHFGIFSAIAIMTAFVADIILLPALCTFFNVNFNEEPVTAPQEAH